MNLATSERPAAKKNAIMAVLQTSDSRTASIDGHIEDEGDATPYVSIGARIGWSRRTARFV